MSSLLDRLALTISPKWAANRAYHRSVYDQMQGSGYSAARSSRQRRNAAWSRAPAADEDHVIGLGDLTTLRAELRDLYRNNGIVRALVDCVADNVVGAGLSIQAQTSNPEWNDEAEEYFNNWSHIADYRQRLTWQQMQRHIVKSVLMDGDMGFILVDNGQVQPIEAERIATGANSQNDSRNIMGVILNKNGIPIQYEVCARNDRGTVDTTTARKINKEDFVFCSMPDRVDQVRGIPKLCSIANLARDYAELSDAQVNKAKLDAFRAYAVKSNSSYGPGNLGPRNATPTGVTNQTQYEAIEQGQVYYLKPGEDIDPLNTAHPAGTYDAFAKLIIREIGASLRMPGLEMILLDFSNASFSSSRAALMQTYRTFALWQEWISEVYLNRVWRWRIAKAVRDNELPPAPMDSRGVSEWYKTKIITPRYDWVDPQAETSAEQIQWSMGTTTLTELAAKRGRDAEEMLEEKGRDIATAIRVAEEINAEHGTQITWQDLIAPPPGSTQVAAVGQEAKS